VTSCVAHDAGDGALHVALVGDSHARQLAPLMTELAEEHDFTLSLNVTGGCPWQVGVVTSGQVENGWEGCSENRATLYDDLLERMGVDVVVLSQTPRDSGEWLEDISAADGSDVDVPTLNLTTMTDTVERIHDAGARVVFVESLLRPEDAGVGNPLECLSGATRTSECRVPVPDFTHTSDGIYRTLAISEPDTTASVNLNDIMCPAWPVCEPMMGRIPVWRDEGHYSAEALISKKDQIWERLAGTGFLEAPAQGS
jgi:hypothetical protein